MTYCTTLLVFVISTMLPATYCLSVSFWLTRSTTTSGFPVVQSERLIPFIHSLCPTPLHFHCISSCFHHSDFLAVAVLFLYRSLLLCYDANLGCSLRSLSSFSSSSVFYGLGRISQLGPAYCNGSLDLCTSFRFRVLPPWASFLSSTIRAYASPFSASRSLRWAVLQDAQDRLRRCLFGFAVSAKPALPPSLCTELLGGVAGPTVSAFASSLVQVVLALPSYPASASLSTASSSRGLVLLEWRLCVLKPRIWYHISIVAFSAFFVMARPRLRWRPAHFRSRPLDGSLFSRQFLLQLGVEPLSHFHDQLHLFYETCFSLCLVLQLPLAFSTTRCSPNMFLD